MTVTELQKPLDQLEYRDILRMSQAERLLAAKEWYEWKHQHVKENALLYYRPASEDCLRVHFSQAPVTFVSAGNRGGKTETCLVEMLIHCTGIVPLSLRDIGIDWNAKLRGPVKARMDLESLTTHLHNVILPKCYWDTWIGPPPRGGPKGHWGWIPRDCLIDGSWEKSWSEKIRTLRILYRDPANRDIVVGESQLQFTSHEMESAKMASGDIDIYHIDEPCPYGHWTEAQIRTASVKGRILFSMTWPDDPVINVDWMFDEIWEPGQPGPGHNKNIEIFRLNALKNEHIEAEEMAQRYQSMSDQMYAVRVEGQPIRFANRVHPQFTDVEQTFCFQCGVDRLVQEDGRTCSKCGSVRTLAYCHVEEFEHQHGWPVVWVLDPHPRKPHMSIYVAVDPSDHFWQVAELECEGSPLDLARACEEMERDLGLHVRARLIDPRMAAQPSGVVRERSWWDEFAEVGLICDPADSSDVGRSRFNELLLPDEDLRRPGVTIHPRCEGGILQLKRFMWADWKLSADRDQKQKPKDKYDDYPACWRYFCNLDPKYQFLVRGGRVVNALSARRQSEGNHARFV